MRIFLHGISGLADTDFKNLGLKRYETCFLKQSGNFRSGYITIDLLAKENDLKFLKYTIALFCCCLGLGTLAPAESQPMPNKEDTDILIFSESHASENYTKETRGTLKISISAFAPIKRVTVNSASYPTSDDSRVEVEHPFSLEKGKNSFLVTVTTEHGKREKSFSITLGKKPKPKKKPFKLITKLDISSLDNVTSSADEDAAQSDTKLTLVLVPIYDLVMGQGDKLRFRGIVLREKYSDSDFQGNEVSYTQIFVQWLQKESAFGKLNAGIGYNDIRTNNENPLLGDYESVVETFVSAGIEQDINKELSWDGEIQVKLKDSKEETTSKNDEADAREIGLDFGIQYKKSALTGGGSLGYSINDAKGDYKDSSTAEAKLKVGYTINEFVPKAEYAYKATTYSNENAGGVKQENKTSTLTLKVDYKWKVLSGSQWTLSWNSKNQTSNVDTAEYKATITTLGFTYVF